MICFACQPEWSAYVWRNGIGEVVGLWRVWSGCPGCIPSHGLAKRLHIALPDFSMFFSRVEIWRWLRSVHAPHSVARCNKCPASLEEESTNKSNQNSAVSSNKTYKLTSRPWRSTTMAFLPIASATALPTVMPRPQAPPTSPALALDPGEDGLGAEFTFLWTRCEVMKLIWNVMKCCQTSNFRPDFCFDTATSWKAWPDYWPKVAALWVWGSQQRSLQSKSDPKQVRCQLRAPCFSGAYAININQTRFREKNSVRCKAFEGHWRSSDIDWCRFENCMTHFEQFSCHRGCKKGSDKIARQAWYSWHVNSAATRLLILASGSFCWRAGPKSSSC